MTQENPSRGAGDPVVRFFGALLMAAGGLIAALSGLCTVGVVLLGGFSGDTLPETFAILPVVVIVGGIPMAIGLAAFFAGRALYRAGKPKPVPETFD